MSVEAELSDGTILEFPDGTAPDVVRRTVKRQLGLAGPVKPAAPPPLTAEEFGASKPARGTLTRGGQPVIQPGTLPVTEEPTGSVMDSFVAKPQPPVAPAPPQSVVRLPRTPTPAESVDAAVSRAGAVERVRSAKYLTQPTNEEAALNALSKPLTEDEQPTAPAIESFKASPGIARASTGKMFADISRAVPNVDGRIERLQLLRDDLNGRSVMGVPYVPPDYNSMEDSTDTQRALYTRGKSYQEELGQVDKQLADLKRRRDIAADVSESFQRDITDLTPKNQGMGGKVITSVAGSVVPTFAVFATGFATGNPLLGASVMFAPTYANIYAQTMQHGDTARKIVPEFSALDNNVARERYLDQILSDKYADTPFQTDAARVKTTLGQINDRMQLGQISQSAARQMKERAFASFARNMGTIATNANAGAAFWGGVVQGLAEVAGENLPLSIALKKGTAAYIKIFGTLAAEAGEEVATQIMQSLDQALRYDPTMTFKQGLEQVAIAGLSGAAMGGPMGAAGVAIDKSYQARDRRMAPKDLYDAVRGAEFDPAATDAAVRASMDPNRAQMSAAPAPRAPARPAPGTAGDLAAVMADSRPLEAIRAEQAAQATQEAAPAVQAAAQGAVEQNQVETQAQAVAAAAAGIPARGEQTTVTWPDGEIQTGTVRDQYADGATVEFPDGQILDLTTADVKFGAAPLGEGTPAAPIVAEKPEDVAVAAARIDQERTREQILAGNDRKGHIDFQGLNVTLENAKGSVRQDQNHVPPQWETTMPAHYGYVKRTEGADSENVDVYIGDNVASDRVYVVDQIDPKTGKFDESKVMLGFSSKPHAVATYHTAFNDGSGPSRVGAVSQISVAEFKNWLKTADTAKSFATIESRRGQPSASESVSNAGVGNAEQISNAIKGPPRGAQADSGVQIPQARPGHQVQSDVLALGGKDLKIGGGVVQPVLVPVVDNLGGKQGAAKNNLGNNAMLKPLPANAVDLNADKAVRGLVPGEKTDVSAGGRSTHVIGEQNAIQAVQKGQQQAPAAERPAAEEAAQERPVDEAGAAGAGGPAADQPVSQPEVDGWTSAQTYAPNGKPTAIIHSGPDGLMIRESVPDGGRTYFGVFKRGPSGFQQIGDAYSLEEAKAIAAGAPEIARKPVTPQVAPPAATGGKQVHALALQTQKEAGWDSAWPFVPADLLNADFRDLISKDPGLSEKEKEAIFAAGRKLGVVPAEAKPDKAKLIPTRGPGGGIEIRPEPIAPAPSSTGFVEALQGMGANTTTDLYRKAFAALQAGETTISGVKDPILSRAHPAFDAGQIKSWEDIKRFEDNGYPAAQSAEDAAKEKAKAALAKLGDLLGKNTRMNITPEQQQKLLPILTELFDAAFTLGHIKFMQATKWVRAQIREALGLEVEQMLSIKDYQGAYISMSSAREGADSVMDVAQVTALDEQQTVEAPETAAAVELPPAAPAAGEPSITVTATTNTKTGEPIWVAKLPAKVSSDEYARTNAKAKRLGGYWSRFAKGFIFKSAEKANEFAGVAPAQEAPNAAATADNEIRPAEPNRTGAQPLAGAQPEQVPPAKGDKPVGAKPESSRPDDAAGDGGRPGGGVQPVRGMGEKPGALPPAAGGVRPGQGGTGQSGIRQPGGNEPSARPGEHRPGEIVPQAGNFVITDELELGKGTPMQKYAGNVAAIKTLKALERENRDATPEEQKILARYVGWGGLKQAFPAPGAMPAKGWEGRVAEIRGLLTPEEHEAAARSIQDAHYTSKPVVDFMWNLARRLGFNGGRVLEDSMGVGNFFGLMPADLRQGAFLTGIELDSITARIAKQLYQKARIIGPMGFEDVNLADNTFNLNVGNPPFGKGTPYDKNSKHLNGFTTHNFFFAKAIDKLAPGGLHIQVVSRYLMDAETNPARDYIAHRAELIGAIRLPWTAFYSNAGTEVVTDIIVLQKLREEDWGSADDSWTKTAMIRGPLGGEDMRINQYYADHMDMIVGTQNRSGKMMFENDITVQPIEGSTLEEQLADVIEEFPEDIYSRGKAEADVKAEDDATVASPDAIEHHSVGAYFEDDGKLFVRVMTPDGSLQAQEITATSIWKDVKPGEKNAKGELKKPSLWGNTRVVRVRGMIGIRETERALLQAEKSDAPAAELDMLRSQLNDRYDRYVAEHGYLNEQENELSFRSDPDSPLLLALEFKFDRGVSATRSKTLGVKPRKPTAEKAPIFFGRQVAPYKAPDKAANSVDGLAISIMEKGAVSIPYIADLTGKSKLEVIEDLTKGDKPLAYFDPALQVYETAPMYLSGNVKLKHKQARDAGLMEQADALKAVFPPDAKAGDIVARLGAGWIEPSVYEGFFQHLLGEDAEAKVQFLPTTGGWAISSGGGDQVMVATRWGSPRRNAHDLIQRILNNKDMTVRDTDPDGTSVVNKEATQAAQDKADEIRAEFEDWVFKDEAQRDRLVSFYNENMNTTIGVEWDGDYLTMPGKVPDAVIDLRRHQLNAIARWIRTGKILLDHVVGSGKAQPLDAKILTPGGWKRMGDMAPGDIVVAGDGTPTVVEAVFPQGEKDIFRVTFSDGSSTECCEEHLWLTQTYMERGYAQRGGKKGKKWMCGAGKVRSLAEIRDSLVAPHLGAKNHSVPLVAPVQFVARDVPIAPYLFGVLLGDGNFTHGGVSITTGDHEIAAECARLLPHGMKLGSVKTVDRCATWTLTNEQPSRSKENPVKVALEQLGLRGRGSHDKFIPDEYLFNSVASRIELLRGLMDTDGSVQKQGTSTYFYTTSPSLADGVTALVQSLGGTVGRSEKLPTYRHNDELRYGAPCAVLCISMPASINPFKLTRKAKIVVPKSSYAPHRYIVAVDPVGRKPAQCIRVSHPEHLYVTDDFIVTHNTFTIVAALMEMRRIGLVQKPMIVVPNHLVEQWAISFYQLYPGAKILAMRKADFTKQNRQRMLARVATGDWDAVIFSHSSFGFIDNDKEILVAAIREQITEIQQAIDASRATEGKKSRTAAQYQKQKEKLEQRMKALLDKPKDAVLTFQQLGVDQVTVDESQEFKNLFFTTQRRGVGGFGNPNGSKRAFDMFIKAQYLQKTHNGRGVAFATGTPISNSLTELFTLQRYLGLDELKTRGMTSLDAWLANFGVTAVEYESNVTGTKYKRKERLRRITNAPEIMQLYKQFTDSVTQEDVKRNFREDNDGKEFPIPKMKGGKPRTNIVVEASATQIAFSDDLNKRAENLPADPRIDNMLAILSDGRKAALDMRMIDPMLPDWEGSKANAAVDNIFRIYTENNHRLGTQLVFLDLSTPSKHGKKDAARYLKEAREILGDKNAAPFGDLRRQWSELRTRLQEMLDTVDEEAGDQRIVDHLEKFLEQAQDIEAAVTAADLNFSVYDDMRTKLIQRGVPAGEIAFIHDFNGDTKKQELFDSVNGGSVRILFGSTAKMGAGTNVQRKLVALHHMDVPWRPSDIEQREGRIIRQGNEFCLADDNFEVEILAYATKPSSDVFFWQTQEQKLMGINSLRNFKGEREIDDVSADSMSAAEMKAMASGNPLILEDVQLTEQIRKLEGQRKRHNSTEQDMQSEVARYKRYIDQLPPIIARQQILSDKIDVYRNDPFEGNRPKADMDGQQMDASEARAHIRAVKAAADEAAKEANAAARNRQGEIAAASATIKVGSEEFNALEKEHAAIEKALVKPKFHVVFDGKDYNGVESANEAVIAKLGDTEAIRVVVDGQDLIRRKDIQAAIDKAVQGWSSIETGWTTFGTIGGMPIKLEWIQDKHGKGVQITIGGQTSLVEERIAAGYGGQGEVTYKADGARVLSGIEKLLRNVHDDLEGNKNALSKATKGLGPLTAQLGKPWGKDLELAQKKARVTEVRKLLAGEDQKGGDDGALRLAVTDALTEEELDAMGGIETAMSNYKEWVTDGRPKNYVENILAAYQAIDKALREGSTKYSLGTGERPAADAAAEVRRIAEQIAPKANLEMVDRLFGQGPSVVRSGAPSEARIEAAGKYNTGRQLMTVAMNYQDPTKTIRHEGVHALYDMGMFTPAEWTILQRESENRWMEQYGVPDNEEGIAKAFQFYRDGGKFAGPVGRAFDRIREFLQRLGNALRGLGYQNVDDIFKRIESGEVGRGVRAGSMADLASMTLEGYAKMPLSYRMAIRDDLNAVLEKFATSGASKTTDTDEIRALQAQAKETEDAAERANLEARIKELQSAGAMAKFSLGGDLPANIAVIQKKGSQDIGPVARFFWNPRNAFARHPTLAGLQQYATDIETQIARTARNLTDEYNGIRSRFKGDDAGWNTLTDALWVGDADGVTFTEQQLREDLGWTDGKTIKAYQDFRTLVTKMGRLVDMHRRSMLPQYRARKAAVLERMRTLTAMEEPAFRSLYGRRTRLRAKLRSGEGDEKALLATLADIEKQMQGIREQTDEYQDLLAEVDRLDGILAETSIRKREGYVPHKFFGTYALYRLVQEPVLDQAGQPTMDEAGNHITETVHQLVAGEHGFYPGQRDAIAAAKRASALTPEDAFVVRPVQFKFPNSAATTLTDASYWALMSKASKAMGLAGQDLKDAMEGVARRRFRRRIAGFTQMRTGVEGFSDDMDKVMRAHVNEVVRYVFLDKLKYRAINDMERMGMSPFRSANQQYPTLTRMVEAYLRDINGQKQPGEIAVDEKLDKILATPWGKPALVGIPAAAAGASLIFGIATNPMVAVAVSSYVGLRLYSSLSKAGEFKSRSITQDLMSDMAHAKLGAIFNMGSAMVNLTQTAINTLPVLGPKYTLMGMIKIEEALRSRIMGKPNEDYRLLERSDTISNDTYTETNLAAVAQHSLARWSLFFFRTTENFNRAVSFLGGYHRAKDSGKLPGPAFKEAEAVMGFTQHHYGPSNKAEILRNVFLRVPGQFKNFMMQQIAFTFELGRKGVTGRSIYDEHMQLDRDAILWHLGSLFLVSGTIGLPFVALLNVLIRSIFDYDPLDELKKKALEMQAAGKLSAGAWLTMVRGLPAWALGEDVSQRAGMGEQFTPQQLSDLAGPWWGTMDKARQLGELQAGFVDQLANLSPGAGKPLKAIEAMANGMPMWTAATDTKAFYQALADDKINWVSAWKNRTEFDESILSKADVVRMAVGSTPTKVAMARGEVQGIAQDVAQGRKVTQFYVNRIISAVRTYGHDDAKLEAALNKIQADMEKADVNVSETSIKKALADAQTPRLERAIKGAPLRMRGGVAERAAPLLRQQ